ncbi:hypothetical protein MDA_GLEAN10004630 [Myotis davidii]|uniref:Uncharacterized protein n=1 Tax=Myotis davidii TaxID=225400 RepID=L5MAZ1_MYODS|nr:hypothetical protein MDA_GLEAN10004630 [Myotis davidii]
MARLIPRCLPADQGVGAPSPVMNRAGRIGRLWPRPLSHTELQGDQGVWVLPPVKLLQGPDGLTAPLIPVLGGLAVPLILVLGGLTALLILVLRGLAAPLILVPGGLAALLIPVLGGILPFYYIE